MGLGTALYAYEQGFMSFVTPERAAYFQLLAEIYLLTFGFGFAMLAADFLYIFRRKAAALQSQGFVPLSPSWLLPYILSIRKYRWYFASFALAYGILYSVVTSMVVYQPTIDFAQAYGATFPSAIIAPCCGPPLFTPIVTVYLVNHLGLLLIPLTSLLLVLISILVGLNSTLVIFAFDNRTRGVGRGWLGGLGAAVGLFTGCPTCAGLFFANVVGGSGAVGFAAALAYYQPVFIVLSIPILIATLFLVSKSLSKVFNQGCVILRPLG